MRHYIGLNAIAIAQSWLLEQKKSIQGAYSAEMTCEEIRAYLQDLPRLQRTLLLPFSKESFSIHIAVATYLTLLEEIFIKSNQWRKEG